MNESVPVKAPDPDERVRMNIEGPFKIGVVQHEDSLVRELHLSFPDAFRQMSVDDQVAHVHDYIQALGSEAASLKEDSPDRQGMLLIQQVAEELLPHISAEEIALDETIVIEIRPDLSLARLIG